MLSYCDAPCTNMRFTFGWPAKDENEDKVHEMCLASSVKYQIFVNLKSQDVGVLRMYFDMRAVILRATEDYSWQSMIGEIGGYAALLLGTAVIDLVRNSNFRIMNFLKRKYFFLYQTQRILIERRETFNSCIVGQVCPAHSVTDI